MAFSATCDIVPGITGGVCKAAKRRLVYIDNPCEIIIIIVSIYYILYIVNSIYILF